MSGHKCLTHICRNEQSTWALGSICTYIPE